ncbi:hypothetical protein CYMTET_42764 [Cymbomonas tetramitiformis]|uniref:Uncharacterized protein n=1 Tax=Cymbomonas tetramitiformis TaxID=36881 RepID=A0AAE0F0P0_9CHLO|nr:hypothetical protein CYMTET_42764 [Cymbomonas tetramitiformis]
MKLVKRKSVEKKLARIRSLCDVCKNTLESMQQSDEMCVTMEVLDTANVFVKSAICNTNNNLKTIDNISDTYHEIQQQAQEVHDAIESTADTGMSYDDLEDELDALFSSNTPRLLPPSHRAISKEEPVVSEPDDQYLNDDIDDTIFPTVPSTATTYEVLSDLKQ